MADIERVCMREEWIDMGKIVADRKIYGKGVENYKLSIKSGKDLGAIVVVRHPRKNLFAVLDGHHRYWALKELGARKAWSIVIQDFVGPLFFFTKEGYLQPTPSFTKYVRVPFIKMKDYLEEFLRNPEKLKDTLLRP